MKPLFNHSANYAIVLGLALLLFGRPAPASQTNAPVFRPAFQAMDTPLKLSGVGELKYLGLIKVYDGALYLPEEANKRQMLEDIPKRLEVRYVRSFKAEDLGPATIAGIKKNVAPETYARLESRIAYRNGLYEDIAPKDRISLTYIPAVGTQVEINGAARGTIEGADFARALFSIWLGEAPFDESFKSALLGEE
jgi:hypothetical protein